MMGNKKLQVWLPLLFSVVMILGMFYGYKLGGGSNFFKKNEHNSLQEALDIIRTHYVDKVNSDSLQEGAIQEMMSELDPHSVYFPPVQLKEVNEELAGNFDGIGVEYNIFNDTINIVYVLPDGPSEKAGLQIGDKIIKVNGTSLTGKDLPDNKIKETIRGEKGSVAALDVIRNNKPITINVTRGSIPVTSVDAAYMIDKTTGYIKLNKFIATSYEDFMKALEGLTKQNMQELVFDLRGNGGGYMDEAIDIVDEFLDGEKLIVYTEGLHSKKREYKCKRPGLFEKGKLVVLVDELSASASEVVSGALQDWCRGTVIGRRTFGKGLVQQQYELSDGSALRLTVARYYTPLGRSIQRPYDKGRKVYMDEVWDRYQNGEALYADSNKIENGKEFKTVCGDVVYGGGGIMPNIFVPIDTSSFPVRLNRLFASGTINSFVYQWYLKNKPQIDKYSSAAEFAGQFNQADALWNDFVSYTNKDSVNLSTVSASQKEFLQNRLQANLARFRWRNHGYFQVLNNDDQLLKKAIDQVKK